MIEHAHKAVSDALRSGVLSPATACEACGGTRATCGRIIYHHWSYDKANYLDVIPLCQPCHRRIHVGTLAEPRTGRVYVRPAKMKPDYAEMASLLIAARGTLSVVGAAERGAISTRMLQHYERGRKLPKVDTLENLISGWGVAKKDAAGLREAHRAACVAKNQARVAK